MDRTVYHLQYEGERIPLTSFRGYGPAKDGGGHQFYIGIARVVMIPALMGRTWLLRGPEAQFWAEVMETKRIGSVWKVVLRRTSELQILSRRTFPDFSKENPGAFPL